MWNVVWNHAIAEQMVVVVIITPRITKFSSSLGLIPYSGYNILFFFVFFQRSSSNAFVLPLRLEDRRPTYTWGPFVRLQDFWIR